MPIAVAKLLGICGISLQDFDMRRLLCSITSLLVFMTWLSPQAAQARERWTKAGLSQLCTADRSGPWLFGQEVGDRSAIAPLKSASFGPFESAAAMLTHWSGRVASVEYLRGQSSRALSARRTRSLASALRAAGWVETYANGYFDPQLGYVEAEHHFSIPGVAEEDSPVELAISGSDGLFRVTCTNSYWAGRSDEESKGRLAAGSEQPLPPPPVTAEPPLASRCNVPKNAGGYRALMDPLHENGAYFRQMVQQLNYAERSELWKRWRLIQQGGLDDREVDGLIAKALQLAPPEIVDIGVIGAANEALQQRATSLGREAHDQERCRLMVEIVNSTAQNFRLRIQRWVMVEPFLDQAAKKIGLAW